MTKKVLIAILASLLIVVGLTSCSDAGSGGGSGDPKRPATLELRNFKESYRLNDSKNALQGTLLYTNTNGSINTVDVKDSAVTVTGFDTSAEASGKIVKFTYQGIDCAGTYSVYDIPSVLDVAGCFVVDDLTTYDFTANSNKVVVEKYASWADYENVTPTSTSEKTYEVKISSNGLVYALVDNKRFYPDGKGEFEHYESDYLAEPEYGTGYYYVSDDKESSSTTIGPTDEKARGAYLVLHFTTDYTMEMWFVSQKPNSVTDIETYKTGDKYTVLATDIKFGTMGVFIKDSNVGATKNLRMYSKNDFKESITVVSSSDDNYRGYSYRLTIKELT